MSGALASPPGTSGPTILMGDGSYFDYSNPSAVGMTIEDYAYALAYTARFRGQTRRRRDYRRCFYAVAQHCEIFALQMMADGHDRADCFAGLMHESGETVVGDFPGPGKLVCPEFKLLEKRCEAPIAARFGVIFRNADMLKAYDLRMLATEKRDLMPQADGHHWANNEYREDLDDYPPFEKVIFPYQHPDQAAVRFLRLYEELRP